VAVAARFVESVVAAVPIEASTSPERIISQNSTMAGTASTVVNK
jgi:hypothetical protein